MLKLSFALFAFLAWPTAAHASAYCHEKHLVLDKEFLWNFGAGFATELPLGTHRGDELMPSMGRVQLGTNGEPLLWAAIENSGPGGFGLEYMVYKIEIRIGDSLEADQQIFSEDFSRACTETGLGVAYGNRQALPAIKVLPHANGEPRGLEKVRIRVWGWQ